MAVNKVHCISHYNRIQKWFHSILITSKTILSIICIWIAPSTLPGFIRGFIGSSNVMGMTQVVLWIKVTVSMLQSIGTEENISSSFKDCIVSKPLFSEQEFQKRGLPSVFRGDVFQKHIWLNFAHFSLLPYRWKELWIIKVLRRPRLPLVQPFVQEVIQPTVQAVQRFRRQRGTIPSRWCQEDPKGEKEFSFF